MMNSSNESDFLTLNPDTIWNKSYVESIQSMEKFYLSNQVKNILLLVNKNLSFDKKLKGDFNLIENKIKKFNLDIKIIEDGKSILNTGGGILNMINSSNDSDFLTLNPDTIWDKGYVDVVKNMEKFYFSKKIKNLLLLVNKNHSFDKKLEGDFNLIENKIEKGDQNNLIYTGCQILNKSIFESHSVSNFSISKVWNELISKKNLYGYESSKHFYHLTNLKVYEEILKNK